MAENRSEAEGGHRESAAPQKLNPWLEKRLLRKGTTFAPAQLSARVASRSSRATRRLPIGESGARLTRRVANRAGLVTRKPENLALSATMGPEGKGSYWPSSGWPALELLVSSRDTERGEKSAPVMSRFQRGAKTAETKNTHAAPLPETVRTQAIPNTPRRAVAANPQSGQPGRVRRKIEETPTPSPSPPAQSTTSAEKTPTSQQSGDQGRGDIAALEHSERGTHVETSRIRQASRPARNEEHSVSQKGTTRAKESPIPRVSRHPASPGRKDKTISRKASPAAANEADKVGRAESVGSAKAVSAPRLGRKEADASVSLRRPAAFSVPEDHESFVVASRPKPVASDAERDFISGDAGGGVRSLNEVISRKTISSAPAEPVAAGRPGNRKEEPGLRDASVEARRAPVGLDVSESFGEETSVAGRKHRTVETEVANQTTGAPLGKQDASGIRAPRHSSAGPISRSAGAAEPSLSDLDRPAAGLKAHHERDASSSLQISADTARVEPADSNTPRLPSRETHDRHLTNGSLSRTADVSVRRTVPSEAGLTRNSEDENRPGNVSLRSPSVPERDKVAPLLGRPSAPPAVVRIVAGKDLARGSREESSYHPVDGTGAIDRASPYPLDLPVARAPRPRASDGAARSETLFSQASDNTQPPSVIVHSLPGLASSANYVSRERNESATEAAAMPAASQPGGQTAAPDLKALARDIYPLLRRMLIVEKERLPHL